MCNVFYGLRFFYETVLHGKAINGKKHEKMSSFEILNINERNLPKGVYDVTNTFDSLLKGTKYDTHKSTQKKKKS